MVNYTRSCEECGSTRVTIFLRTLICHNCGKLTIGVPGR